MSTKKRSKGLKFDSLHGTNPFKVLGLFLKQQAKKEKLFNNQNQSHGNNNKKSTSK